MPRSIRESPESQPLSGLVLVTDFGPQPHSRWSARDAQFHLVPGSWVEKAVANPPRFGTAPDPPGEGRNLSDAPGGTCLAINKPFECRSAVLPPPSFRPMPEGYILCPPSMRQRESRGWGLEEAWQP